MTELVLKRGDIAIATLRKPEMLDDLASQYGSDRLLLIRLDVTKISDIINAFAKAKETYGRINIVFNNAGYGICGEVESIPDDLGRSLFETNFWGAANITREAVKFFREANPAGMGGLILQNSSMAAINGIPGLAHYTASKFALEGFTESLSRELNPEWKIKIVLVEPGWFRTKITTENVVIMPITPAYEYPSSAVVLGREYVKKVNDLPGTGDVDKGNQALYEFVDSDFSSLRLPLGLSAIKSTKDKIAYLQKSLEEYEQWSADLLFDHPKDAA